jgi:NRAMP (natural resistance-associated macrophage protein)-like metal ion transporter
MRLATRLRRRLARMRAAARALGPGVITGAADDDPSGIATYSQAGAQFGLSMLWTVVLTLPLMAAIQVVSARIGYVTGQGLAANIKRAFPRPVLLSVVGLLLVANTLNIAADIAAMAGAMQLVAGGSPHAWAVGFGMACLLLQVFVPYHRYVGWLKWLTLSLLAYVAVVLLLRVDWGLVLARTLNPQLALGREALLTVVAVFGTTISPYLFFWQASQEVEDRQVAMPRSAADVRRHLDAIRWDTGVGMTFSNLVAFFIILATGVTLHAAGITDIQTSAQAAQALRPVAGNAAFLLFACGIVATGLLAVPVLAGSAAYAVAESAGWQGSLALHLERGQGKGFYAIIAAATLGGVGLCFMPVDPVRALFWAAVINGVISVPIMAVMMMLAGRRAIMGGHVLGVRLRWLGWAATGLMGLTVVALALMSLG